MISEAALKGYLLEEALAWVLHSSGYRLLVHKSQDPGELEDGRQGLCVKGRGAEHQVDVLGEFAVTPAFSLPIRLFLEAKFRRQACPLHVLRNAHGVIHDINENFGLTSTRCVRKRYRYEYALFSTSGFTKEAQDFATAQLISTVNLSGESFVWLRESIEIAAKDLFALQKRLHMATFPVRWMRGSLREMFGTMPTLSSEIARYPEPHETIFAEQAASALHRLVNTLRVRQPGELLPNVSLTAFIPPATADNSKRLPDNEPKHKERQIPPEERTEGVSPANVAPNAHAATPARRPYWLDRPCPPWCFMTAPHEDHDLADDRSHMSAFYHVDLTLEDALTFWSANHELLSCEPAFLTAMLLQHYREREPRIIITWNGKVDIPFTVTEAGELAQALVSLVSRGADQQSEVRDDPCPPWCTALHETMESVPDRVHIGEYTMMSLTLDQPDYFPLRSATDALPQLIGVRLEQPWREFEPRIVVIYRDEYLDMTLAEARDLTEALIDLTGQTVEGVSARTLAEPSTADSPDATTPTGCLEGRFRQGVNLHVSRSEAVRDVCG